MTEGGATSNQQVMTKPKWHNFPGFFKIVWAMWKNCPVLVISPFWCMVIGWKKGRCWKRIIAELSKLFNNRANRLAKQKMSDGNDCWHRIFDWAACSGMSFSEAYSSFAKDAQRVSWMSSMKLVASRLCLKRSLQDSIKKSMSNQLHFSAKQRTRPLNKNYISHSDSAQVGENGRKKIARILLLYCR